MLTQSFEPARTKTLSMLEATLENSKKQLIQLRKELADDPKKLANKEREFMLKECAKLENIGNLQARLDAYREAQGTMTPLQRAKSPGSSEQLGLHLRTSGQFRLGRHWQAHHIVCSKHPSHGVARFKLFAYLGINDPHNGCWLPSKHKYATGTVIPNAVGHSDIHTEKYAIWVRNEIRPANSKNDLVNRLRDIRMTLHNAAKDLPDLLTDNGKQDLQAYV